MPLVLITHVNQYAGPGALSALLRDSHKVMCHDVSFVHAHVREDFDRQYAGAHALAAQTPEEIHDEVNTRWGLPDAIVSNAVYPINPAQIEAIPLQNFRATFEAVVVTPIRLTQLFLPGMKERRAGAFVFVTSAR
jgi:3-oxoacyl-[acyl-carrier protein] reductase